MKKTFKRFGLNAIAALTVLGATSAAQAEIVSYDFVADIFSGDARELSRIGLSDSGQISGSFSFDTEAGWSSASSSLTDDSMSFSINELGDANSWLTTVTVDYNDGEFLLKDVAWDSPNLITAKLSFTGQEFSRSGDLPSTLTVDESASGLLTLFVGLNLFDEDLRANIVSLTKAGAVSTPELNPASGGAAIILLLGGAALMTNRRRRQWATV